jgi:hypothetical protein
MNKETFWVVISGFLVGSLVVFFVYKTNYEKKISLEEEEQEKIEVATSNNSSSSLGIQDEKIKIIFPEDQSIHEDTSLEISGEAPVDSWVVVFVNGEENIIQSDKNGLFSHQAKLEFGSNVIKVNSFDENDTTLEKEITVICSTNDLDEKLVSEEEVADEAKKTKK